MTFTFIPFSTLVIINSSTRQLVDAVGTGDWARETSRTTSNEVVLGY